jgi:hypothetical protein
VPRRRRSLDDLAVVELPWTAGGAHATGTSASELAPGRADSGHRPVAVVDEKPEAGVICWSTTDRDRRPAARSVESQNSSWTAGGPTATGRQRAPDCGLGRMRLRRRAHLEINDFNSGGWSPSSSTSSWPTAGAKELGLRLGGPARIFYAAVSAATAARRRSPDRMDEQLAARRASRLTVARRDALLGVERPPSTAGG